MGYPRTTSKQQNVLGLQSSEKNVLNIRYIVSIYCFISNSVPHCRHWWTMYACNNMFYFVSLNRLPMPDIEYKTKWLNVELLCNGASKFVVMTWWLYIGDFYIVDCGWKIVVKLFRLPQMSKTETVKQLLFWYKSCAFLCVLFYEIDSTFSWYVIYFVLKMPRKRERMSLWENMFCHLAVLSVTSFNLQREFCWFSLKNVSI